MKINIPNLPKVVQRFLDNVSNIEELPGDKSAAIAHHLENGVLKLYLPAQWNSYSDAVKRELLMHEVSHWVFGFHRRVKDKNLCIKIGNDVISLYNIVQDAVIHHLQCSRHDWVETELPFKSVTFERLGIPPMPADMAYDLLKDSKLTLTCSGCKRHGKSDDSQASQDTRDRILADTMPYAEELGASIESARTGRSLLDDLPPLPEWIDQVIAYLRSSGKRNSRRRSFRRPSKRQINDIILPIKLLVPQPAARIFVDASGSITDEQLKLFLTVVINTPELASSDVVVFDDKIRSPLPCTKVDEILQAIKSSGGGTCIRKASRLRLPSVPAIWFTDKESGDGLPEPHDGPELWVVSRGDKIVLENIV